MRWMLPWMLCFVGAALAAPPPNPLPPAQVATRTLENGLLVVARNDPAAPMAAVELWVRAGSVDDGGSGAAHALEHMAFRGSETAPAGQVDAAVESVGGALNATTYPDATRYWTTTAPDRFRVALAALANLVRPPLVHPDDWERERRVMLEEIARDQGDLAARARRALAGRLFGASYGAPVMGTPEALTRLTPEDIRAFHRKHYRPDAMIAVIVAPFEAAAVFKAVDDTLGRLPVTEGRAAVRTHPRPAAAFADVEADHGGALVVGLAWPAPSDDAAVVDVLNTILRQRLSAALGPLARRVEVSHPWQRADMVTLTIEGAEQDRAAIRAALRRVAQTAPSAITEAEVAAAIRRRQWAWWQDHEKPSSQARTLGLAAALGRAADASEAYPRLDAVSLPATRRAATRVFEALKGLP